MKGLFIPDITAEMFRNGCLESIESLMAEGEIYDIEYNKEPHWIPVSEALPEEAGTYMCTCMDAGRTLVTSIKWQPRVKSWNLSGARAYWKVLAWQEMPEPYVGDSE